MDIYRNDFFRLYLDGINVWIEVFQMGYDMKEFSRVNENIPRLKLTNFGNLNKCLIGQSKEPLIVAVYKDKIEIEIAKDELEATIKLNITDAEYDVEKDTIVTDMVEAIKKAEITTGIMKDEFLSKPILNQKIVIAKGIAPIAGEDAVITYFKISEKKPTVLNNGNVNHYELNLIDNINVGEWLGEKKPATNGIEGVSVKGEAIPAKIGRDATIKYDNKTVACTVQPNGMYILYALKDGAVKMDGERIGVDNHLMINGDVDYTTGNIDFDGYVTVSGVVKDGFSVVALNDITVNGDMGVGAIGEIRSKKGSIFIKGGVNGKNTARIIAGQNVYLKYCNEAEVISDNTINIGFYSMDSSLKAKKIIVNPEQGRIIGGKIDAEHQIIAGTIGNKSERRTDIYVKGFERGSVKDELDAILIKYKELLLKGNKLKRQLEIFESNIGKLDDKGLNTYKGMAISYEHLNEEIRRLNNSVEIFQEILKTRGDGEVQIKNSAYPKTFLEIKNIQKRIKDTLSGAFYVQNNDMHFE